MKRIDLNCDAGEGMGQETALFPLVTSANIACGAHAGDAGTMADTMKKAQTQHVVPGAHPGFADREHFGRRELPHTPAELHRLVSDQLDALREHGAFHYVKPHGALYNLAARDAEVARVVVQAVRAFDPLLGLLALDGSELWRAGIAAGLQTRAEAFADRAYDERGRLVPRQHPDAVLATEEAAAGQVLEMVTAGRVRSITGTWVPLRPDSICLHGDHPGAVGFARKLRELLHAEGVAVQSCWGVS